jgi:uncharacterized membrane protein YeiH
VPVRGEPLMFRPRQLYAIAAIADGILFVSLSHQYGVGDQQAAWIVISVTLLVRVIAIRFSWTTVAVKSWKWPFRKDRDS